MSAKHCSNACSSSRRRTPSPPDDRCEWVGDDGVRCEECGAVDPMQWHGRLCPSHAEIVVLAGPGVLPALRALAAERAAAVAVPA